jgi:Flp pilus assembly protein TadD
MTPRITYGNPNYKHAKELPQNKYDPLLNAAEKIDTSIEMSGDAFERLGDLMLARKKYFPAFLNYEKSLEKNKDNIRVDYKKGLALLGHGKTTQAASQFQLVLKKQPDFAQAYEGLGRVNFSNKNYETGIINFKKALELDPLLWRSCNFLGNMYDGLGRHDQAVQQYKTALTLKPDAGFIYNNFGVSLYLWGDPKAAVKAFHQALKSKYTRQRVHNNLGLALAAMGRYNKALDAFKHGGSEAGAYNNLGYAYLKNGHRDKAVLCFKKAIELNPKFYVLASENLKKCRVDTELSIKETIKQ